MNTAYLNTENEAFVNSNPRFRKIIEELSNDYSFSLHELSHELSNITTLINSSLQLIESSHPEVKNFKYWSSTMGDVHYLIELLTQLSSFNNGEKISLSPINLNDILTNIINSFTSDFSYSHIHFLLECSENIPLINGDSLKLKQVFINLIKNACESECETITVRITQNCNALTICVQDNGCGIPSQNISQIFKPMVTYKTNGTGLGLSICKRIIMAHHGQIQCDSIINQGTTFTINLPIMQFEDAAC